MNVVVNGEARSVAERASVDDLARALGASATGVAVAVNEEVVARSAWATTGLSDGDRVEVLGAMQGG
ncbi:MAG: sulfur carrier protein ThiS [Acidimicrobiales bacterium]